MTKLQRVAVLLATIVLSLALGLDTRVATAASEVRKGQACKVAGKTVTFFSDEYANKGKIYTCRIIGGKLKYGKPVVTYRFKTLLTISEVWRGSQVTLSLLNSDGISCTRAETQTVGECKNFYIGWEANWQGTCSCDDAVLVSYADEDLTVISGIPVGAKGSWYIAHHDSSDPSDVPIIVKRFAFKYDY